MFLLSLQESPASRFSLFLSSRCYHLGFLCPVLLFFNYSSPSILLLLLLLRLVFFVAHIHHLYPSFFLCSFILVSWSFVCLPPQPHETLPPSSQCGCGVKLDNLVLVNSTGASNCSPMLFGRLSTTPYRSRTAHRRQLCNPVLEQRREGPRTQSDCLSATSLPCSRQT